MHDDELPPARIELILPVAGTERANEKNSSVRSDIVLLLLFVLYCYIRMVGLFCNFAIYSCRALYCVGICKHR